MDSSLVPGIVLSLIFSFFFSGIEIAFLSANKLHLELQAQQGILSGKIMSYFIKRQSWFIGTTLIGNTVALVIFGAFMAQFLVPVLYAVLPAALQHEPAILIIQTALSTLLVLFVAEFLPKSLFLINPNQMLAALALPFGICFIVLFPLMIFIVSLSKFVIVHLLRLEYSEVKPMFGLTDLNNFLKNMYKVKHEDEDIALDKKIFDNALEFKTVRVRECMIPRTEIVAANITDDLETLTKTFVESGHSKIIIYKETIDDIVGYCHSSALFKNPKKIEEILTPIILVPETTLANELMIRFISERKSLAAVMDEFGGTSGIVSMEDVIEEIFGDIEDEHDEDSLVELQLDKTTYLFSGRHEIDYLNETYHLNLPTGDYDTLGGLILSFTEDFPAMGETITIAPFTFTIQSTEENRIGTVRLSIEGISPQD